MTCAIRQDLAGHGKRGERFVGAQSEVHEDPGAVGAHEDVLRLQVAMKHTLQVRGVFPNTEEILTPGLFVRVRVPIGEAHRALLVADRALDTDQGQKIVYVVNDKNEVVSRPIRLGALHDGLRVIEDGLKPGERVIVNGLQQVRPGVTVEPKLVDMPVSLSQK